MVPPDRFIPPIDTYITMCIIMTMNIYITPENEKLLRSLDGSMSGLINQLLAEYFADKLQIMDEPLNLSDEELDEALSRFTPQELTPKRRPPASKVVGHVTKKTGLAACKHGYHPALCKHAKGGKPCK